MSSVRGSDHPILVLQEARGFTLAWFGRQFRPPMSRSYVSHILAGRRPAPQGFYEQAERILAVPAALLRPTSREPEEPSLAA